MKCSKLNHNLLINICTDTYFEYYLDGDTTLSEQRNLSLLLLCQICFGNELITLT